MKKHNNILLVGGGTGGHIVPIYNLFLELQKKDISKNNIYIVGGGGRIEAGFFGGNKNYFILKTGKLIRHSLWKNLWQAVLFVRGIFSALILIKKIRPKVVFSKGGYVAYPIIFWTKFFHIPLYIHESDSVIGGTNKKSANYAKKVFVGFPTENYELVESAKLVFTGQLINKNNYKKDFDFGFSGKNKTIFITGGSLGAMSLNNAVFAILPKVLQHYNVIHQVGNNNYDIAIEIRSKLPNSMKSSYFIKGFLNSSIDENQQIAAICQADLVIARAGATTIAEIAQAKKPMILVPYPYASADHQLKNAQILEQNKCCVIVNDRDLDPENLFEIMEKYLVENNDKMVENAHAFFPTNGLSVVCESLICEVKK